MYIFFTNTVNNIKSFHVRVPQYGVSLLTLKKLPVFWQIFTFHDLRKPKPEFQNGVRP